MLSPLKKTSLLFLFLAGLLIMPLPLSAMEGRVSDTGEDKTGSGDDAGLDNYPENQAC
jgi:hypothetical protein